MLYPSKTRPTKSPKRKKNPFHFPSLRQYITPIDNDIRASRIRRSIAREVKIQALDFLGVALAADDGHAIGLVDGERAGAHLGVEKSGGDNVDAREVPPLARQRLPEVRHVRLGRVVDRLVRRHVHDVRAHARRYDQVACALAFEDFSCVLGAVDYAVDFMGEIGGDD